MRQNDKSNASNPPETEASATTTLPVKSVPVPSENLISIHYVHFNNMNESGIKKTVDRLSHTSPMEDVMLQVMERENADFQECTIELYSSEGYPLNINEFTSKSMSTLILLPVQHNIMYCRYLSVLITVYLSI